MFIKGDAPDEDSQPPAEKLDEKARVSAEVWFENLDSRIPESLRRAIARLHSNTGHPSEADMIRNVSFAGGTKDALLCIKALRCAV